MRPIGRLWEAWTQLGRSAQRLLATNAEQREPTRGGQVSHIHPVTQPSLSQESSPSTHPPPLKSWLGLHEEFIRHVSRWS